MELSSTMTMDIVEKAEVGRISEEDEGRKAGKGNRDKRSGGTMTRPEGKATVKMLRLRKEGCEEGGTRGVKEWRKGVWSLMGVEKQE